MIQPGREALAAAMVARFLRRLAGTTAGAGDGRRGDDPWPGRLPDPVNAQEPSQADPGPHDGPDAEPPVGPVDPDAPDEPSGPDLHPDLDAPDGGLPDPPGGPDLDAPDRNDVAVDVEVNAGTFAQLAGANAVSDADTFQLVLTVGEVADDWDVLRGAFTKSGTSLQVTAVETSDPLACALWNGRVYGDAQASCRIYVAVGVDYGLWYGSDDGGGNVNGYHVQYDNVGAFTNYSISRYDAGVRTVLLTQVAANAAANSRLVLVRRGSKIALVILTAAGAVAASYSATDATYTTGQLGVGGGTTQGIGHQYREFTISPATAA